MFVWIVTNYRYIVDGLNRCFSVFRIEKEKRWYHIIYDAFSYSSVHWQVHRDCYRCFYGVRMVVYVNSVVGSPLLMHQDEIWVPITFPVGDGHLRTRKIVCFLFIVAGHLNQRWFLSWAHILDTSHRWTLPWSSLCWYDLSSLQFPLSRSELSYQGSIFPSLFSPYPLLLTCVRCFL